MDNTIDKLIDDIKKRVRYEGPNDAIAIMEASDVHVLMRTVLRLQIESERYRRSMIYESDLKARAETKLSVLKEIVENFQDKLREYGPQ